ncbi:MAG: DUF2029 domain-containing protein [Alphaproteobacteria bacterium]|nr:DUF2029 domain-containing protein [Alphaproteobacteria bacterium]
MSPDWSERLRVYPRIFVILYVLIGGWWVLSGPGLLDRGGNPVGGDFVTFYAAGALTAAGTPELAYSFDHIHAAEQAALGAEMNLYAWHYPPTALVPLAVLAALPFGLALGAWLAASVAMFVIVVRQIREDSTALWLALAFPGLFQNLIHGQNGCLTLALVGGGLTQLDRRPALAGFLIGLLGYKPHLLPMLGLALLAGRRWTALAVAIITPLVIAAGSLVALGEAPWVAFAENIPFAMSVVDYAGPEWWQKMPSVTAALRLLGVAPGPAHVAQGITTVIVALAVAWLWWTDAPRRLRNAGVALSAVLATPYVFHYDLVLLALPILWLANHADRRGWTRGLIALVVLAWFAPVGTLLFADLTGLQTGPILNLALLAVSVMAARRGR